MSVEPTEAISEVWTRWQGHVINGAFPLGRCIGSSDHSGVFFTRAAERTPAEAAIKLVPTNRALAELLLPRWKRAGGLAHPHLLPLLQWGGCQLDGLPYLYALLEYADQTLAQLLQRRALTDDEVREMLVPVLDALAFLHGEDLVHGQLKPSNILVVGDQLKLASDTIRRVGEGAISTHTPTAFDPPEGRQGNTTPASDIWALGVTIFQALTRRLPLGVGDSGNAVVLPADFSPVFRDVVARCLSRNPHDRPTVTELSALVRGQPVASAPELAPSEPEPDPEPEPETEPALPALSAVTPRETAPEPTPALSTEAPAEDTERRTRFAPSLAVPPAALRMALGAAALLVLVWVGVRVFSGHRSPAPPAAQAPAAPAIPQPMIPAPSANQPAGTAPAGTSGVVHEVVPDVPVAARRTIRGHIKIWVRVIVNPDGSVFAASPDRAGPSGYFLHLALEAARKWSFAPAESPPRRVMQVRFDFSRDGVTGKAAPVH